MIRLFIAFELPSPVRERLARMITHLKKQNFPIRYVRPDNMHLTLRFLGDSERSKVQPLADLLDDVAARHEPIIFHLTNLGGFPNLKRARVIWIGLGGEAERLKSVASDIESAVVSLGFESERKGFKAHLTLGRLRQPHNLELLTEHAGGEESEPRPICFESLQLIQSTLTPSGPIYQSLHQASLAQRFE